MLTPEGSVLTFGSLGTDAEPGTDLQSGILAYDVWHPERGQEASAHDTLTNTTGTDLFCAGQIIVSDTGDILTVGGDLPGRGNDANADINLFDPNSQQLRTTGLSMKSERWYPTVTTLPNGEILIQAGRRLNRKGMVTPEIYSSTTGLRSLLGATSNEIYDEQDRWWYPRSWVAPNGKVFGQVDNVTYWLDPTGEGSIELSTPWPDANKGNSSSAVMYAPGKILQIGGSEKNWMGDCCVAANEASVIASIIDINGPEPIIRRTAPMMHARHWADTTVLPDGKVLVIGGSLHKNHGNGIVYVPEIWDPATERWTALASHTMPRLYHSTTLLLPDGRLLVGGGGAKGPVNNFNVELFSPPYLFDDDNQLAKRPDLVVADTDTNVSYGASLQATSKAAADVQRVTLIKTGSVTHSFDMEQRFMELPFKQNGESLEIQLPSSSNLATPGFYLLFALDAAGVPSQAQTLHLQHKSKKQESKIVASQTLD